MHFILKVILAEKFFVLGQYETAYLESLFIKGAPFNILRQECSTINVMTQRNSLSPNILYKYIHHLRLLELMF